MEVTSSSVHYLDGTLSNLGTVDHSGLGSLLLRDSALLVNQGEYVSPGLIHWTRSGEVMVMVLLGGCFMVLVDSMDYVTAMSSVIAALMNIGPGFGDVGPSENYAFISDTGKWFLAWNMMVGRLEMFSALVVFYPSFWKK